MMNVCSTSEIFWEFNGADHFCFKPLSVTSGKVVIQGISCCQEEAVIRYGETCSVLCEADIKYDIK